MQVDVGRVHYDYVVYVGTRGPDIGAAYGPRATGRSCGRAASRGSSAAAGRWAGCTCSACWRWPTARARSSSPNPTWCATRSWSPPLRRSPRARGIELVVLNPKQMAAEDFAAALHAAHGGQGFDDIVVIVASTPAIEAALPHLAPDGLLVIFGGLARGTMAALDVSHIYLGAAQITGSAGSTIHDQASVMRKVAAGNLTTANAVAAVGGLDAARDGMQGLMDGRFPGKMVIFPQVASFPLTALADLKTAAPSVFKLLGPTGDWTREAEAEFLRLYAHAVYG